MKILVLCLIALYGLSHYVESVAVFCEFKDDKEKGYKCEVKYMKITSKEDRTITDVTGDHLNGNTFAEVVYFDSDHNTIKFFPLELKTFFKNLVNVRIVNATMSEIHSSDLHQFDEQLMNLWLSDNEIEFIESDLFQFNENLNVISFYNNKLRHIDNGTFGELKKLVKLRLDGNSCIDKIAHNRNSVIDLIPEAELDCKDYPYMVKYYKTHIDELKAKLLDCKLP